MTAHTAPFVTPLAPPVNPDALAADVAALPAACKLLQAGEFEVFCATASAMPHGMQEIARLREWAFRAVGEGTGRALDTDRFDHTYHQLFVWHRSSRAILGAYRLGFTAPIVAAEGVGGLYTHSLFDFDADLLAHTGPCIELGRSFVHPEWQGSSRVLRLLWGGIARVLDQHPEVQRLFGPVSISPDYSDRARNLLLKALQQHHMDPNLQPLVRPRHPHVWQPSSKPSQRTHLARLTNVLAGLGEIAALAKFLQEVAPDLGLPMLIKHYLGLQGRFAAFNVDADFNNTLDGLVFVEVHNISPKLRRKLTGAAEAKETREPATA
jgi:putative hemolysin